jgi:hypothetical protein
MIKLLSQYFFLILLIAFVAFEASGQKTSVPASKFDVEDFNAKFETAQWLAAYDEVAWKTSDVVVTEDKAELAKLGREWFCFQDDKKIWHAVYGKFEKGKYTTVFHYVVDSTGKIAKSLEKVDQQFLDLHAQALSTAVAQLQSKIPEGSPTFNQYLRRGADKTFEVWMLPAFQTNGTAVYGGEAVYHIDTTGTKILKDQSTFKQNLLGFKAEPPREIWLNYREMQKPTLGAIFFVWYYKTYFTNIYIDNSISTSTLVKDGKNGYVWVHVEKDEKQKVATRS